MRSSRSSLALATTFAAAALTAPALAGPVELSCSYPGSGFEHVRVVLDYDRQTVSVFPNSDSQLAKTYKTIVAPEVLDGDHVTHHATFGADAISWRTVGSKWLADDALAPVTDGAREVVLDRKTGEFTVDWSAEKPMPLSAHANGVCIRRSETNLF